MADYKLPPGDLLMQISNNASQEKFAASFRFVRNYLLFLLREAGVDPAEFSKILDFGCGVGRLFYAIHDSFPGSIEIHGCDLDKKCVEWCESHLDYASIERNGPLPPLSKPDALFDLVFASSVYSHLPLDHQMVWAVEMHRCLLPGGVLLFSTHGPAYFPTLLQSTQLHGGLRAIINAIGSDGLFMVIEPSDEGDYLGQREIASAHTRTAVQDLFPFFNERLYVPRSGMAGGQDVYVLERVGPDAIMFPVGSESGDGASRSKSGSVLRFSLNGQSEFHCFLEFRDRFLGAAKVRVEISSGGEKTAVERTVASSQIFGPGTFYPLSVSLPPAVSEAAIRLDTFANQEIATAIADVVRPICF